MPTNKGPERIWINPNVPNNHTTIKPKWEGAISYVPEAFLATSTAEGPCKECGWDRPLKLQQMCERCLHVDPALSPPERGNGEAKYGSPEWKLQVESRIDALGGLQVLYHAITGRECERHVALGIASSAVTTLQADRDSWRRTAEKLQGEANDFQRAITQSARENRRLEKRIVELQKRDAQSRLSGCWCDEYGHPCKACEDKQEAATALITAHAEGFLAGRDAAAKLCDEQTGNYETVSAKHTAWNLSARIRALSPPTQQIPSSVSADEFYEAQGSADHEIRAEGQVGKQKHHKPHKYIPTQLYDNSPCAWDDHPDGIGDPRYCCGRVPSDPIHTIAMPADDPTAIAYHRGLERAAKLVCDRCKQEAPWLPSGGEYYLHAGGVVCDATHIRAEMEIEKGIKE